MIKPHFIIGGKDNPYMLRWYLIPRNRWFNIYLHKILRDDDDRALHDHPWDSLSIVLAGRYREVTFIDRLNYILIRLSNGTPPKTMDREYGRGSVIYRPAVLAHRLEVVKGPVWTLFLTSRRIREWGFHCPRGWVPWHIFVDSTDTGNVGKGCDDGV
jgi:hypothetical protein